MMIPRALLLAIPKTAFWDLSQPTRRTPPYTRQGLTREVETMTRSAGGRLCLARATRKTHPWPRYLVVGTTGTYSPPPKIKKQAVVILSKHPLSSTDFSPLHSMLFSVAHLSNRWSSFARVVSRWMFVKRMASESPMSLACPVIQCVI